jgi:predicted NBD/HSP70 family sugar kinase
VSVAATGDDRVTDDHFFVSGRFSMSDPLHIPGRLGWGRSSLDPDAPLEHRPLRGLARRLNEQAVVETIFQHGPLTRVQVASKTGLSKPTVSSIVDDLVRTGLVRPIGRTSGSVGRTAALYRVDAGVGHVVGVDLGGTKVVAAVADVYGQIVAERVEPTDTSSADELIAQIRRLCRETAREAGVAWSTVRVIAIGVPGTVDPVTGTIKLAYNIPDLGGRALADAVRGDWEVEVLTENDVNLAAVGEQWRGLAKHHENFAVIAIGTGIGAGLVVNGDLCNGAGGAAGEIGYLPLGADPHDPDTRLQGPLEAAIGGRGIAREAARRLAAGEASSLTPDCTAADVFEAAAHGDSMALAVVDRTVQVVALAIAAVTAVVAPEIVILGGSVGANPLLLEPVRRATAGLVAQPVRVEQSALSTRAALIGAVALGLQAARTIVLLRPHGRDD